MEKAPLLFDASSLLYFERLERGVELLRSLGRPLLAERRSASEIAGLHKSRLRSRVCEQLGLIDVVDLDDDAYEIAATLIAAAPPDDLADTEACAAAAAAARSAILVIDDQKALRVLASMPSLTLVTTARLLSASSQPESG